MASNAEMSPFYDVIMMSLFNMDDITDTYNMGWSYLLHILSTLTQWILFVRWHFQIDYPGINMLLCYINLTEIHSLGVVYWRILVPLDLDEWNNLRHGEHGAGDLQYTKSFNTLRPRHNGRHFPDDIFKCIFLIENVWISLEVCP